MESESDRAAQFVQTSRVNPSDGAGNTGGIMIHLTDAELRACEIDPGKTDWVGVRVTPGGDLSLYEALHAADEQE